MLKVFDSPRPPAGRPAPRPPSPSVSLAFADGTLRLATEILDLLSHDAKAGTVRAVVSVYAPTRRVRVETIPVRDLTATAADGTPADLTAALVNARSC